jgi:hypothetical protein
MDAWGTHWQPGSDDAGAAFDLEISAPPPAAAEPAGNGAAGED